MKREVSLPNLPYLLPTYYLHYPYYKLMYCRMVLYGTTKKIETYLNKYTAVNLQQLQKTQLIGHSFVVEVRLSKIILKWISWTDSENFECKLKMRIQRQQRCQIYAN